jgi:hypothetical protein
MSKVIVKDDITKWLSSQAQKQLKFAQSKALNEIAFAAQKAMRDQLPRELNLKSGNFLPSQVQLIRATKNNLTAVVGITDRVKFAQLLESGGVATPTNGFQAMSIAEEATPKNAKGVVTKTNRPAQILKKKGYFVKNNEIYKRNGDHLIAMFSFVKRTKYKPMLNFQKITEGTASKLYADAFNRALLYAFNTAK